MEASKYITKAHWTPSRVVGVAIILTSVLPIWLWYRSKVGSIEGEMGMVETLGMIAGLIGLGSLAYSEKGSVLGQWVVGFLPTKSKGSEGE